MQTLHEKTTVAITHDHTMYDLAKRRCRGERAVFSNYYAPLIRQGGVDVIGWVVGGDPPFFGIESKDAWWGSLTLLDMLWLEAKESPDTMAICLNYQDIDKAVADGKIALLLTIEGGAALEAGDPPEALVNLRTLYRLGVRSLQLLGQEWNQIMAATDAHPAPSKGLTPFGRNVIQEMNRLGILIDLAHIPDPDPIFQEILEISKAPLIDSHRGTRGVTSVDRNIGDERIKKIAKSGGLIGLQFFSVTLAKKAGQQATLDDLISHIDHIVEIAGIDHIALGPDYLEPNLSNNRGPGYYIKNVENLTKLPHVTEELIKRGYSEKDIKKVMGENMLRLYKEVMI